MKLLKGLLPIILAITLLSGCSSIEELTTSTYSNSTLGISFKYPKEWGKIKAIFRQESAELFLITIGVRTQISPALESQTSCEDYLNPSKLKGDVPIETCETIKEGVHLITYGESIYGNTKDDLGLQFRTKKGIWRMEFIAEDKNNSKEQLRQLAETLILPEPEEIPKTIVDTPAQEPPTQETPAESLNTTPYSCGSLKHLNESAWFDEMDEALSAMYQDDSAFRKMTLKGVNERACIESTETYVAFIAPYAEFGCSYIHQYNIKTQEMEKVSTTHCASTLELKDKHIRFQGTEGDGNQFRTYKGTYDIYNNSIELSEEPIWRGDENY